MLKAIAASKKKNDAIDAGKIADLVRCHLLPACYVAAPQVRELRRLLRYRNLVVRDLVRMQNKIAGLLMESGAPFHQQKLHGKKYFAQLLDTLEEVPDSVKDLLRLRSKAIHEIRAIFVSLLGHKCHADFASQSPGELTLFTDNLVAGN